MTEENKNLRYDETMSRKDYFLDANNSVQSPLRLIVDAVAKNNPELSGPEVERLAKGIILNTNGHPDEAILAAERIEYGRNFQAKQRMGTVVLGDSMMVSRAELIEAINSGTYTSEEYFTWIEDGTRVIKNMTDGEITSEDLNAKVDLLVQLDQREVELMVCLSLYRSSGYLAGEAPENEKARARYKELEQKLIKLREVRSAVKVTTKDKADEKVAEQEHVEAMNYVAVMTGMSVYMLANNFRENEKYRIEMRSMLGRNPRLSEEVKMMAGIPPYDKEKIKSLYKEVDAMALKLQNEMLRKHYHSMAEMMYARKEVGKSQDVRQKILALQGIDRPDSLLDKKYVESIRKKQFDLDKYNMLEKELSYTKG